MPGKRALLALALALCCGAPAQPPAREMRILFTGDILLSRQVSAEMQRQQRSPWAAFVRLFHDADLVSGNLEGAIGEASACLPGGAPCFAEPPSSAALLHAAGFTLLTAANNHAGDLGAKGRHATSAALQGAGLAAVDFARSPQFFRVGESTLAVVALSLVGSADGEREQIPSLELVQKMRLARRLANIVVVSIHWGNELQEWISPAQQQQAQWLVEHGADLVVGHHPHVIQPPACVEGRPVFYSLGNHLFDQKYVETKEGLIADCRLRSGQMRCGALRSHTESNTSYPRLLGRDEAAEQALQGCIVPIGEGMKIHDIAIKPAPWSRDQPADGVVLEGYREGKLQWRSRRQDLVSLEAAPALGAEPLLLSLERHASSIDNEFGLRPYVYALGPGGLIARWRGSALAWPLLDATVAADGLLCALHRDDSFLISDPETKGTRIAAYRWNGFGFSGVERTEECRRILH